MQKNARQLIFLLAPSLMATGDILAAPESARAPAGVEEAVVAPPQQAAPQHQHHHRGPKQLALSIADDAQVELWAPDLNRQKVEINQGKVGFRGTGVDNYHAIVATRTEGNMIETAIRYEYARGKPSGRSPAELTAVPKSTLEIVPDPIPREHYRYHSDQTWGFIVRFQGQAIANQQVTLETANGSQREGTTNPAGRVNLHIPDDFPDIVAGERDKRSAEFTVSTRYTQGEQTYQTTLNAAYRVNPQHWHSLGMGIAVVGLGMLTGGVIGRLGRGKNNKEQRT